MAGCLACRVVDRSLVLCSSCSDSLRRAAERGRDSFPPSPGPEKNAETGRCSACPGAGCRPAARAARGACTLTLEHAARLAVAELATARRHAALRADCGCLTCRGSARVELVLLVALLLGGIMGATGMVMSVMTR
jgi:hypothetical protein